MPKQSNHILVSWARNNNKLEISSLCQTPSFNYITSHHVKTTGKKFNLTVEKFNILSVEVN